MEEGPKEDRLHVLSVTINSIQINLFRYKYLKDTVVVEYSDTHIHTYTHKGTSVYVNRLMSVHIHSCPVICANTHVGLTI